MNSEDVVDFRFNEIKSVNRFEKVLQDERRAKRSELRDDGKHGDVKMMEQLKETTLVESGTMKVLLQRFAVEPQEKLSFVAITVRERKMAKALGIKAMQMSLMMFYWPI